MTLFGQKKREKSTPESTDSDTLIRINYHFSSIVLFEHYQMVDGHHTDAVKIRIYSHYITVLEAFLAASMCCHLDESREASSPATGFGEKYRSYGFFETGRNWKKREETGRIEMKEKKTVMIDVRGAWLISHL